MQIDVAALPFALEFCRQRLAQGLPEFAATDIEGFMVAMLKEGAQPGMGVAALDVARDMDLVNLARENENYKVEGVRETPLTDEELLGIESPPEPDRGPVIDRAEAEYNARDVLSMCRIYPILARHVEARGVSQVYDADVQMAHLALQMTRCGMPVDAKEREGVRKKLVTIRDQALQEIKRYTEGHYRKDFLEHVAQFYARTARKDDPKVGEKMSGDLGGSHSHESAFAARVEIRRAEYEKAEAKDGINFGAKVVQAAILRSAGVPLLVMTEKTGLPKLDKEILEGLSHHHGAKWLLSYSLTSSAINNFIDGIPLAEDGRIHPEWVIHKITGRWGSSPNVQNWSKRAGGGVENIRRMVVAPPGYKIVYADYAQLEARIIAAASGDEFLVGTFARREDIHSAFAAIAFPTAWPKLSEVYSTHKKSPNGCGLKDPENGLPIKCDFCKERDKVRDLTKRLEYGGLYGGAAQTLWQSVVKDFPDIQLSHVHNFLQTVERELKGVMRWRQRTLEEAITKGEIRSPILGRIQFFPLGRVDPTVAYNYKAQSGGADLWALGAIEFCKRWNQSEDEARICHNGHDSVLILCKEQHAAKVATDVKECWERVVNDVPMIIEPKAGDNWADLS